MRTSDILNMLFYGRKEGIPVFSNRFWRIYRVALAAVLLAILVPTIAMCFYTRPSADDLAQPLPVMLTWRETGSLLQTLVSAFETMADIYLQRNAIFFSMLLSVMPFSIFGVAWSWLNAVLAIVLLLGALWHAASAMPHVCPGVRRETVHCAALLLCIMVFLFMPSYHEGIYWFSGAANYTYTISMAIFLFVSLFKACVNRSAPVWRIALWCVGFFCLGGSNWMTPTASIVLCGAMAVWMLYTRRPKRLLLPFVCLLAGYLVAVLSPGNANRQAAMGVDVGLVEAFFNAFLRSFLFIFEDVRYYVFAALMLPVFVEMYRHSSLEFKHALWVPALSVCLMAATMFPVLYQSSYWNARHTNACFLTLAILIPINLFWIMGWMFRRLGVHGKASAFTGRGLIASALCVLMIVGVLSVPDMSLKPLRFSCTLQPVRVMMHLLDGQAKAYAQWYDDVVASLQSQPGGEFVLTEMRSEEFINPGYLITDDPQDWMNQSFAAYFGRDNTVVYKP